MDSPIKRAAMSVPGGFAGLGRLLGGVSRRTVWAWHYKGSVPAERCPDIEAATGGAVTCEELRPDVSWHVLRNAPPGDRGGAHAGTVQARD